MENIEHIIRQPSKRRHPTPLLFLHGAWHGAWCWNLWMDYFASLGYEVHAISLPGHGGSSLNRWSINFYNVKDYMNVLETEAKKISPTPAVIGHSLGGALLQKYLETHQVPAAVLLASVPSKGMLPMMTRLISRHPAAMIKAILTLNLYHVVKTPELAKDLFLNADTHLDAIAYQKQLARETYNTLPLMFPFGKINPQKSPMLVMAGEKDVIFTIDEESETAKKYGAKLIVIEGQAHSLMMESEWQAVANTIDKWLTDELPPVNIL